MRRSLLLPILCASLLTAVSCHQDSSDHKIDRGRQQASAAGQELPEIQITSDNAADLLPIVLDELVEFDNGRAWTEVGEHGFFTALEFLASTDDDHYAGAGLSLYCTEDPAAPGVRLVLRLFQWDPVSETSTYATLADKPEGRMRVKFGNAPDARWLSWNVLWAREHVELADATYFLSEAKRHNVVRVRIPLPGRAVYATFSLWPGMNTPIQPNLDWCGLY